MKTINKKAQIGNIQGFILAIVGVAVVLSIGLIILGELAGSQCTYGMHPSGICKNSSGGTGLASPESTAFNATVAITNKLTTIPTWIGILVIVALAFIVLSFFSGRQ